MVKRERSDTERGGTFRFRGVYIKVLLLYHKSNHKSHLRVPIIPPSITQKERAEKRGNQRKKKVGKICIIIYTHTRVVVCGPSIRYRTTYEGSKDPKHTWPILFNGVIHGTKRRSEVESNP